MGYTSSPARTAQKWLTLALLAGFATACAPTAQLPALDVVDSKFQGAPAVELSSVQKRRLAERVAEYYDQKLLLADPENFYLQRLLDAKNKLEAQSGESYRYGVYLSNRIHAFALASGDIRLHSGLLDVVSADDEILALVACLQTLVRKGFADEAVEQSYNAAIATDPSIEAGLQKKPFPEEAIRTVAQRTTLYRFSLEQLHACDVSAAAALEKIGADPKAVLRLTQRLARFEDSTGDQIFDISRTQPGATQRLTLLAKSLGVDAAEFTIASNDGAVDEPGDEATAEADGIDPADTSDEISVESLALDLEKGSSIDGQRVAPADLLGEETDSRTRTEVQTATLRAKRPATPAAEKTSAPIRSTAPEKAAGAVSTVVTPQTPKGTSPAAPPNAPASLVPGWYVQVSADVDQTQAYNRAEALRAQQLPVAVQEIEIAAIDYFRVLIGPFPDQAAAQRQRQSLGKTDLANGDPFVRSLP